MPELNLGAMYGKTYTAEPATKKPAIIKISCGIGDTDGFPAFDVDSDAYAAKDDPKWGFLITGGAEFHMPLTVFQVTPDGLADKGGIRLGDIILEINEEDATQLTLAQAHERIDATGKKIHFVLKGMDDEDLGYEQEEGQKTVVLRVPKPPPPPKEFTPTALLGSRCWHPVMWHDPPAPPKPKKKKTKTEIDEAGNERVIELSDDESSEDETEKESPHQRIIRNIRRFFAEVGDNAELKQNTIENMLMALPSASRLPKLDTTSRQSASAVQAGDDDDDKDFLSTTFTWNLRNVPKLTINDEMAPLDVYTAKRCERNFKATQEPLQPRQQRAHTPIPECPSKPESQEKLCKYERCWPWADREKIIYKQSTCHLVPRRKCLGLVEQRKQLLAKQNALENLQHLQAPN